MGFNRKQWEFTEKHIKVLFKDGYTGKKMLELGCQEIKHNLLRKFEREGFLDKNKRRRDAKYFFKKLGFKVISIDKMKCLSSEFFDLREPFPDRFLNKFDIVTNYGTTEHVQYRRNQYQTFKNIHDCLKVGGIFIHIVPGFKSRSNHSKINYGKYFFPTLAKMNDYKIIEINNTLNIGDRLCHIAACMIKTMDVPFSDNKEEFFKHIIKIKKT